MKRNSLFALVISCSVFCSCNEQTSSPKETSDKSKDFGGFDSNIEWGQHIVTVSGCHDCHSPKIMTPMGPKIDSSRLLSGHPADLPDPDVNRQELQRKGLFLSNDLTAWVGPWGISYTANLTSDSTGTGAWSEEQFIYAIRNGKFKGLANGRPLLPPMPWDMYRNMTDDELKAVFAYLQSTKPIRNIVPPPKPPVSL